MANRLAELKRRDNAAPNNPITQSELDGAGGRGAVAGGGGVSGVSATAGGGGGNQFVGGVDAGDASGGGVPLGLKEGSIEWEVAPINDRLKKLEKLNKELAALQKEYMLENDKELQQKVDRKVAEIGGLGLETRGLINNMNDKTQKLRKKWGTSSSEIRLRNTQFTMLSNQLIELTKATWNSQNKHNTNVKGMVARRLKVRYASEDGKTLTDDQAQEMATQLVESNQQDQVFALAREELIRCMRTQEEMAEIENSMKTLHQIFMDMQLLIDEQSEGLDAVQDNVERAAHKTEKGEKALYTARKGSKCCIQ